MNIGQFWKNVRAVDASLPAGINVWITSLQNPSDPYSRAGVTVACERKTAAKYIVEGWHRVATEEEILAVKVEDIRRTKESEASERMRKSETRLQLTPAMLELITSRHRRP